jgi:hypothetical protein
MRPSYSHQRATQKVDIGADLSRMAQLRSDIAAKYGVKNKKPIIPEGMTFLQWCERLAADGLKVDGKPFRLDDRPALRWIYDQVPSTHEQAFRHTLVLMKCAQVGFTVMEMLATIYLGLKFSPSTVGMFLPDQALAQFKSTERFMPVLRTIPDAYALMTQDAPDGSGRKMGEGNVRTRRIADSLFVFSWTSGRVTTESMPMDILAFDEVQEMTLADMEKTRERLSGSPVRYNLMGSTANWPDTDIHHWFKSGTQHQFHTRCPACDVRRPLDEYFPNCIAFDPGTVDMLTGRPGTYRYVCEAGHWIDDPQDGEWIPKDPTAWIVSAHFPQFLSPTITAGEIMDKYTSSTDKKNFHNRVLGKPFLDPSQVPVSLEHMANCVAHGKAAGVRWKKGALGAFMGIDQMGNFNVVVIKERMADGRQAVIHIEEIYSEDPFARCDELMKAYGVAVAVVENNPNYNDSAKFARRHAGRVFICNGFGSLPDEMVRWGDAPKLDVSERRTSEDERDRYTVKCDQFKCMQTSFGRFTTKIPTCLWPDPQELFQDVIDKEIKKREAIAPRAFLHFTKTALVTEKDEETNQFKRRVVKLGIDPHFSYANQLCDVAWARAHGTATFHIPDVRNEIEERREKALSMNMPGLPTNIVGMLEQLPDGDICGNCEAYPRDDEGFMDARAMCSVRHFMVQAKDPGCPMFVELEAP